MGVQNSIFQTVLVLHRTRTNSAFGLFTVERKWTSFKIICITVKHQNWLSAWVYLVGYICPLRMSWLREHLSSLLNKPSSVDPAPLTRSPRKLVDDLDLPPCVDGVERAISQTNSGKAPGMVGIPAEIYKAEGPCSDTWSLTWHSGQHLGTKITPKGLRGAAFGPSLQKKKKNKGSEFDSANYRRIWFLSVAGKILASVILNHLISWSEYYWHGLCSETVPRKNALSRIWTFIIIINSLTARVVGATQILQPVFSIFPCSPLPSWTCRTPGLSIPWCCLPTSSFACLVFFPLSLCLARWFRPDLINGRHVFTTAVCVSLRWSGLRVVRLLAGYWHGLLRR